MFKKQHINNSEQKTHMWGEKRLHAIFFKNKKIDFMFEVERCSATFQQHMNFWEVLCMCEHIGCFSSADHYLHLFTADPL